MAKWRRFVIGPNDHGKSCVISTEATMVKQEPGVFYRVDLWCTGEMPIDNSRSDDRALVSKTREPKPNGTVFRALEIFPDSTDRENQRVKVENLHKEIHQKRMPTEEDYKRHPSMHRTDSLDYITCVKGEIYLMTDVDEVLMKPGDVTIIRGVNHAWSNRSTEPALLIGVMVDAVPQP
jgi:mannose-6-phosphate isomerase-like protein (cupin superfamily)